MTKPYLSLLQGVLRFGSGRAENGGFREPEQSVLLGTPVPEAQETAIHRPASPEYQYILVDAKRALATIEDQRNDQVLLVGEMLGQHDYQPAVLVGIGVGGEALLVVAVLQRPDEGVCRLGVAFQPFMDRVMIGIENLETAFQPGFSLGEDRKSTSVRYARAV